MADAGDQGGPEARASEGLTLRRDRRDLLQCLEAVLQREPGQEDGQRLRKRYAKCEESLIVIFTDCEVPFTNDESERTRRPSATLRKVTNGQRSQWGADQFGAVRSVVGTGGLNDLAPLEAIALSLEGNSAFDPV